MKRSKTERALIAPIINGSPVVLATDGEWIASDCNEVGTYAEDIGIASPKDCPEPGLYLWTGFGQMTHDGSKTNIDYHGELRRVRPDEVEELFRMQPPEDQAELEVG